MASSSFLRGNGNSVAVMLFLMTFCLCCTADLLDSSLFSQTLTKLATDGLGVSNLQEHFDRLKFTETVVDGSQLIPNLAASVSNKFRDRFHVVQRLKIAVESSWPTPPSSIPTECCRVSSSSKNAEYDSRFRKRLDISSACVKVSQNAPPSPKHVANSVVEEMKNILQDNPFIKWQYFASEEGTLANYPAFEDTEDCRSYDPRFRPFYVETATPKPKDVVLVLDTSGSMKGSRLRIAKEAAKTFLSTTNPRDRIGIVSFSDKAATPIGYRGDGRDCHSERLADATPINIKYMDSYVDSLSAGGDTQYSKAFRSAFNLLKGSSSGGETSRTKVIIFLTDGKPTDEPTEIMQTIQTENAELDNKVVIMTYGMEQDLQILRDIANQDGGRYGVSQTSDVTVSTTTVFTAQSMAQDEEKFRLPIRVRTLNLPIYWLRDFSRGDVSLLLSQEDRRTWPELCMQS